MPHKLHYAYPRGTGGDTLKTFLLHLTLAITSFGPPAFVVFKVVKYGRELAEKMRAINSKDSDTEALDKEALRSQIHALLIKLLSITALTALYFHLMSKRLPPSILARFRALPLHQAILRYTETSIYVPETLLPPDQQKIVAFIPHGQMPLGLAMPGFAEPFWKLFGSVR